MSKKDLNRPHVGARFPTCVLRSYIGACAANGFGDSGSFSGFFGGRPYDLWLIGTSARQSFTMPGNRYVFGLIQHQFSHSVSGTFGLRKTARSRPTLPLARREPPSAGCRRRLLSRHTAQLWWTEPLLLRGRGAIPSAGGLAQDAGVRLKTANRQLLFTMQCRASGCEHCWCRLRA